MLGPKSITCNYIAKIHLLSKQFCTIFIFWKGIILTKPFQPSQSWHQLSFFEKGIIVQNFYSVNGLLCDLQGFSSLKSLTIYTLHTPNLWFDTDFIAVSIYRVEFDAANNHSFSPLCYHNKAMFYDCLEAVFNELKHKSCPQNWVILILMASIFNLAFSKQAFEFLTSLVFLVLQTWPNLFWFTYLGPICFQYYVLNDRFNWTLVIFAAATFLGNHLQEATWHSLA